MFRNVSKIGSTHWKRVALAGAATTLIFIGLDGGGYLTFKGNLEEMSKDVTRYLKPGDIQESFASSGEVDELEKKEHYINRIGLQNKINSILDREIAIKVYCFVY